MKKGTYYIGDPCYIFDKSWKDVLHITDFFSGEEQKLFGKMVCGGGTAYGDGYYLDNFGRAYAVDAGLIAIIPVSLLKRDVKMTRKQVEEADDMHIVTMEEDFSCSVYNGVFHFGDIVIDTLHDASENEEI